MEFQEAVMNIMVLLKKLTPPHAAGDLPSWYSSNTRNIAPKPANDTNQDNSCRWARTHRPLAVIVAGERAFGIDGDQRRTGGA
jgi:hypothetical protein